MRHYRHQIVVQTPSPVSNSYGGPQVTWATLHTVWGKIEPIDGGEELEAGSVVQKNKYLVRMWYRSDITTELRLTNTGRTFQIESVVNVDERNQKLELICYRIDDND